MVRQFVWKKNAQPTKDSFEKILIISKRSPNLIEIGRGKKIQNNIFRNFVNNNDIKHYSRTSLFGSVFAESFNRNIKDILKRPVFEKRDGNWVDTLPIRTKQYDNRVHTSTKLTAIQVFLEKNERFAYRIFLDKRKEIKPK